MLVMKNPNHLPHDGRGCVCGHCGLTERARDPGILEEVTQNTQKGTTRVRLGKSAEAAKFAELEISCMRSGDYFPPSILLRFSLSNNFAASRTSAASTSMAEILCGGNRSIALAMAVRSKTISP